MRVALAAILFSAPDLLLLDEPTNYLDLEGVLWLEDFLKRYRGTVLIVSHDRDLLNTAAEFILHLETRQAHALHRRLRHVRGDARDEARARRSVRQEAGRSRASTCRAFVDRFKAKASKARQAQSRMKMLAQDADGRSAGRRACRADPHPASATEASPPLITMRSGARWAMSRASRSCRTCRCASIPTTASRCSARTATANRRSRSCWPASSTPMGGETRARAQARARLFRAAPAGRTRRRAHADRDARRTCGPKLTRGTGAHAARRVWVLRRQGADQGCATSPAANARG